MLTTGSLLVIGETGSGKTTQIGEVAVSVKKQTGLNCRLYTADRGGVASIQHLIDLGIIEVERFRPGEDDIWLWLRKATTGQKRDDKGNWSDGKEGVGLFAFESMTSFAEELMLDLRRETAAGRLIGGKPSFSFKRGTTTIASNTETHYGLVQETMREEIWRSQNLPGLGFWTARLKRDEEDDKSSMLGPLVVGKALTTLVPSWFRWTFRIQGVPGMAGAPAQHILWLQEHTDGQVGSYSNARVPLAGFAKLPAKIIPASVPEALELVEKVQQEAMLAAKKAIGL